MTKREVVRFRGRRLLSLRLSILHECEILFSTVAENSGQKTAVVAQTLAYMIRPDSHETRANKGDSQNSGLAGSG